jgi:short-subunit dehydrogenase
VKRPDEWTVGPGVTVHAADVCDDGAVERAATDVRQAHGPAALVVSRAGVSVAGPFLETDEESFDWVMGVNFGGTVRVCRAFLPQLRETRGDLANVASCFGWVGFPTKAGYCASKFAVRGFSEALRAELRAEGIGVTVVYPGPVYTNIVHDGRVTDEQARDQEATFLAGRGSSPDRVARRIIRGVEANAARVVVGLDYRLIDLIVRLAPTWGPTLIGRLGRRLSSPKKR